MITKLKLLLLSVACAVALLPARAWAQQITPTQQAASRYDVCSVLSVSGAVNTAVAVTSTPPNGQFVYVCGVDVQASQDATATANTNLTFSSTNLNSWHYTYSLPVSATSSNITYASSWAGVVRAPAAGTAVTIVSPAATVHTAFSINLYYYFAP